jgi:hypothetical protein
LRFFQQPPFGVFADAKLWLKDVKSLLDYENEVADLTVRALR